MSKRKAGPRDLPSSVAEFNSFPDDALQGLVEGVNRRAGVGLDISITLFLSGVTVSGILISSDEFYQAMTLWAQNVGGSDIPGSSRDPVAESIHRPDPADDDDLPDVFSLPSYVHLKSAAIYLPTGAQRMPAGAIWRGRLTQVSAWFLGALETPLR
jgi:hypothetical protein